MVGWQVDVSGPEAPLENVLYYDPPSNAGVVVAGGRNRLYMLSADNLSLEASFSVGPNNVSLDCPPHALPCDHEGTVTDNDNLVLLPLQSGDLVMACGTAHGECSVHQVSHGLNMIKPIDGKLSGDYAF